MNLKLQVRTYIMHNQHAQLFITFTFHVHVFTFFINITHEGTMCEEKHNYKKMVDVLQIKSGIPSKTPDAEVYA